MTDTLTQGISREESSRAGTALLGIGTATPPSITQVEAMTASEAFSCDPPGSVNASGQRAWLHRVFSRCGVTRRGTVLAKEGLSSVLAFYPAPSEAASHGPTTGARMVRYAEEAPPLMERAARGALEAAGVAAAEITHVITVSCTGFYAPGMDVEMVSRLALLPSVQRTHIGFMGCHAAFNALGAAHNIVRGNAGARVLVCCVELCTLHFSYGWNPERLVANALFADGAAACVVGSAEAVGDGDAVAGRRWEWVDAASLLIPDSRDAMTWRIGDHGFEMTLSAEIPALIGRHLRPWCEAWLGEGGAPAEIAHWAIHPGGPRVLTAAAGALGLPETVLHASRAVLAEHGNMSSATVLFVLRQLLEKARAGETCVALGFGPGLMAEGMMLRCVG